jgi:hypothetical protein
MIWIRHSLQSGNRELFVQFDIHYCVDAVTHKQKELISQCDDRHQFKTQINLSVNNVISRFGQANLSSIYPKTENQDNLPLTDVLLLRSDPIQ